MKHVSFKCKKCKKGFSNKFDFFDHKNTHNGQNPVLCFVCGKNFNNVKQYLKHVIQFTSCNFINSTIISDKMTLENDLKYVSDFCSSHTDDPIFTEKNLLEHLPTTINLKVKQGEKFYLTPTTEANFACCCGIFKINTTLENKFQIFPTNKHFKICNLCNKKFSSFEQLSQHICFVSAINKKFVCSCAQIFLTFKDFKVHIAKRPYNCCKCSMKFDSTTNLIRHIRTHTKQKPFICQDCGRGFSQSAHLKNHSSLHLGIQAVKCSECNFSCKTVNGLLKHKQKHKEGSINNANYIDGRKKSIFTYSCTICNKEFLFKRNMGMHMKSHRKKYSLCTECGKVFDSKGKLSSHYKACHKEPSVCETCGKTFASAVLLNAHEKIHASLKMFSCNICKKKFSIKNYLVQHIKTHSNRKQFSCTKCGKLFKVAVSLKYHKNICSSLSIPIA